MKFRFPHSGIVISVVVSVIAIFLLYSGFVFVLYDHLASNLKENKGKFEQVKEQNKQYIQNTKLKNDLTHVIKDVTYTNFLMLDQTVPGKDGRILFDSEIDKKRLRLWENRILPQLDSIDNKVALTFSDEVKGTFNRINDEINEIKLIQDKIVGDVKVKSTYSSEDLKDLKKKGYNLPENFNSFLTGDFNTRMDTVSSVKRDDDIVVIIVTAIVVFALVILITNVLIGYLKKPINQLDKFLVEVRNGNLPGEINILNSDFRSISRSVNYIIRRLHKVRNFAFDVAHLRFDKSDQVIFERDGELGNVLSDMQKGLQRIAQEDKQRNHINQGLSNFSEILGNNTNNLQKFCEEVIINLVKFLNANQGAMFVVNGEGEDEQYLEMMACYAYNKKKFMHRKVKKGQGLAGQAWLEGKRVYMTEVPDNYVTITSGLGFSTPRCVLIIPLNFNDETHGVIELASFQELENYELGFVERVSESISSSLASVKVNATTQALLTQAEDLTVQMRMQEEEMRSHVEELRVTQEESQRREEDLIREIRRLKKRLQTYERNF